MKKASLEKTFLEELSKVPLISIACKNAGLSRQSVYRWMEEDAKFKKKVDKAMKNGERSINDLAESKMITKIKQEDFKAIKFWLENHKKNYMKPRPKNWEALLFQKVMTNEIKFVNWRKEYKKAKNQN